MRHLAFLSTALASVAVVIAAPLVSAAVQTSILSPGDSLNVSCSTSLAVQSSNKQAVLLNCAPQLVATSTPSPTATVAVITTNGVPVCADPGATMWHNLVRRNADGSIACTYGHEHGDDPHQLDRTFGPMGGWWNHGQEQDLSYPWETMNENETKHSSYKIIVRGSDAQPLQPWYTIGSKNYIKAFRGEYHLDGAKGFVMSEYHSFDFEAQICSSDGNCGIARFGGVQDLGERLLTHDDGTFTCVFPNPNIPANQGLCGTGGKTLLGPRSMAGGPDDSRRDETWYSANNKYHQTGAPSIDLDFGVILNSVWSPIHVNSPMDVMSTDPAIRGDYPPHYRTSVGGYIPQNVDDWHHGTSIEVSALGMSPGGFSIINGRINANGFTDRYGNVVQGCTAMGPDCVPFQLTNVPAGPVGFRDQEYSHDTGSASQVNNYDVTSPVTNGSLTIWPN
jgi:hypothetical protein